MGTELRCKLLGPAEFYIDGKIVDEYVSQRAQALLAYLALDPKIENREQLATLLWDDREQKLTLSNLRSLIGSLPAQLRDFIDVDRSRIRLKRERSIHVDALMFEQATGRAQTAQESEQAYTSYQGLFLEGIEIRDSQGLIEWIEFRRERYRRAALELLQQLAAECEAERQFGKALGWAQRAVGLDPIREANQRRLIRLFARMGEFEAAIAQFQR